MKLIVSLAAAADLRRLRCFLANKNPDAAGQAAAVLASAIQSLDTMPGRGRRQVRPIFAN
jgi:plasmid stabilization system protein ParE